MKKIAWLTENFVDVDLPIINELRMEYKISWFISHRVRNNFYSLENICKNTKDNIDYEIFVNEYRYMDIRSLIHYFKILKKASKKKSDIFYLDMSIYSFIWILPLIMVFLPRKKILYAVHDVEEHSSSKSNRIVKILKKFAFLYFCNFQLFSSEQKDLFIKKYGKGKQVFSTNLCLKDYGVATIEKHKKEDYDNILKLLFFGELRENKGIADLIKCVNLLPDNIDYIRVYISGYTSEIEKYTNIMKDVSIYNLDIRIIPDNEIPNLFRKCHYVLLPYRDMTQSGILTVAYKYNVPVICSSLDSFKNYVSDGVNGFIYDFRDYATFEIFIEKIRAISFEEYLKICENQERKVQDKFSIDVIIDDYKQCFNKLIF